jgi:hypothetical protein
VRQSVLSLLAMKTALLCIMLALLGLGFFGKSHGNGLAHGSQTACHVGDRASLNLDRVPPVPGEAPKGPAVILRCHRLAGIGSVQIVGYRSTHKNCVAIDYPDAEASEGLECFRRGDKRDEICGIGLICPMPVGWFYTDSGTFSHVSGFGSAQVARVVVELPARAHQRKRLTVLRIPAHFIGKFNFPQNFKVFIASLAGCPGEGKIFATAIHGSKRHVARVEVPNLLPEECSA